MTDPPGPTPGGSLEEVDLHQLSVVDLHPARLEGHNGDASPADAQSEMPAGGLSQTKLEIGFGEGDCREAEHGLTNSNIDLGGGWSLRDSIP